MEEQGFDALSQPHTSSPSAGVDDVMAALDAELNGTPRDETGKFTARQEDTATEVDEDTAIEAEDESEPVEGLEAEAEGDETDEDAAPEEASGEEEEGDEPDTAIDAPASWTAEEKAAFAQLPPETQATIAARESERERSVNARLAETAAERKATQAEREAAQTERQNMAQFLSQVSAYSRTMDPIIAKGMNTDWAALAREEGADEAMAQKAEFEQRLQYLNAVEQETARIQQATAQQHAQREAAALKEKVPELSEETALQSLRETATPTLVDAGFSAQEIEQTFQHIPDHRHVVLLKRLVELEQREAQRKAIQSKKAPATPQKVLKPKAAQDAKSVEKARVTALRKHVKSDPNDLDALTELAQRAIGA